MRVVLLVIDFSAAHSKEAMYCAELRSTESVESSWSTGGLKRLFFLLGVEQLFFLTELLDRRVALRRIVRP